jgi:protein tyrosine phosphatase (PTP) superfamily phosphohydrolase (DUF442 family)
MSLNPDEAPNPFDLTTPQGQRRAWWNMQLADHGCVRSLYNNFFDLGGGMFRCSQPSPAQIRAYHARYGIRTIINLRGANPYGGYWLEKAVCEELGIELVNYRLYSRDMPSVDEVLGAKELFERMAYPALMHCKSGADRAGLGALLFRHFRQQKPVCGLTDLNWKYGHFTLARTGILDYFIAAYCKAHAQTGIPFMDWLTQEYDQKALTRDYEARSTRSRLSEWLVEKVLRRE